MTGSHFLLAGTLGAMIISTLLVFSLFSGKPKRLLWLFLVLSLSVFLVGLFLNNAVDDYGFAGSPSPTPSPAAAEPTQKNNKVPLQVDYPLPSGILKTMVSPLSPAAIDIGTFDVIIIGASFQRSSGTLADDSVFMGNGLVTEIQELSRQFDIALTFDETNSKSMDGYLTLYIAIKPEDNGPDEPLIPRLKISAQDDKGQVFKLLHYSYSDLILDPQYPYGIILLKGFYSASSAEILINDTIYNIDLTKLK